MILGRASKTALFSGMRDGLGIASRAAKRRGCPPTKSTPHRCENIPKQPGPLPLREAWFRVGFCDTRKRGRGRDSAASS